MVSTARATAATANTSACMPRSMAIRRVMRLWRRSAVIGMMLGLVAAWAPDGADRTHSAKLLAVVNHTMGADRGHCDFDRRRERHRAQPAPGCRPEPGRVLRRFVDSNLSMMGRSSRAITSDRPVLTT